MASEFEKVCQEFQRQWSSGRKAKITMECHAGKAHATLVLSLGRAPGPSGAIARTRPPSYARRQRRRKELAAGRVANETTKATEQDAVSGEATKLATAVDKAVDVVAEVDVEAVQVSTDVTSTIVTDAVGGARKVAAVKAKYDASEDTTAVTKVIVRKDSADTADTDAVGGARKVAAVKAKKDSADTADTAEQAVVVLENKEVVRRRKEKLKSLYERSPIGGWYRCLVCNKPNELWLLHRKGHSQYTTDIENHITEEHWDTINEVEAVMRREVMARREANFGVEDPVRWESYYKTHCKLRRGLG